MEQLINYLLQFGNLNEQQQALITSGVEEGTLETGSYFSKAGAIASKVGFVVDGVIRICYYNHEGEDVTRYFVEEGQFVVDLNSFNDRLPSTEYIQAVTPVQLYTLSFEHLQNLSDTILHWDAMVGKIVQKAMTEKYRRISPMLTEDAKTRYLAFQERFPTLINRIPLHYIASYIGITKHSLSRIRRSLNS